MTPCVICGKPNDATSIGVPIPTHHDGSWLKRITDLGHHHRTEGEAHLACYSSVYQTLYGVPYLETKMADHQIACPNCGVILDIVVNTHLGGLAEENVALAGFQPAPVVVAEATPAAVEPPVETPDTTTIPQDLAPAPPVEEAPAVDAPVEPAPEAAPEVPAAEPQPVDTAPAPPTEQPVESQAPTEATTSPTTPPPPVPTEAADIQKALDDVVGALVADPTNAVLLDAKAQLEAAQAAAAPSA